MTDAHTQHNQEAEERIVKDVKEYGFHIGLIEGDHHLPDFAYTIDLYQTYHHPEIVCFGLKPEVMGTVVTHAADLVKSGQVLKSNHLYAGFSEGYQVRFLVVQKAQYSDYFGYAGWFYQGWDFPVLQLLWPDKQHSYPWEEGFNPNWKFKQPLLDRNTDFKFYEKRHVGVYTTKQVLEGKPILYVYHDKDGDWQFHSEADPQIEDARVVRLEEITQLDPSVNQIYYLPYGGSAWRESMQDERKIEKVSASNTDEPFHLS